MWPSRILVVVAALCADLVSSQPNIDGGRGDLPGMKQDMFDQMNKQKKGQQNRNNKGPPECPKSDKMTPFKSLSFTDGELYVRLEELEGPCLRLISIGGANLTVLRNASLTCGPAGEWKKRVAEEMSAVFFQGGLDWVKSDNETIEVILEVDNVSTTFQVPVTEEKYTSMMDCWRNSCGCEQANNPKMKLMLFALLVIALGGLSWDSVKLAYESLRKQKPSKYVQCKKEHRMVEVKEAYSHICDICGKKNTCYQCTATCNYDLCKVCYKAAKKKQRAKYKEWLEKHPDDEDNKKKDKDDEDKDDDENKKDNDSQSEAGDKKTKESEAESGADGSEAEKDGTTPPTTGDEKAKSEDEEKEEKDTDK